MKMNYTNFTIEKRVYICEQPRDSAVSIVQLILTFGGLILLPYFIWKKDKRNRKERLEKEGRDKIADIIEKEYNKMEAKSDEKLRKLKEDFQAKVTFHGSGESRITGLDVLRFMLINFDNFRSYPLKELQQDLNAVVTLFRSLRIKLPLKGDCPENIKEELAPLITGIGEIARSFVPAKDRYTITNVLKYFGSVQEVESEEDEKKKDGDHSRKIRRFFPYIGNLCLGTNTLDIWEYHSSPSAQIQYHDKDCRFYYISEAVQDLVPNDLTSALESLELELCKNGKTIKAEDLGNFANQMDAIWKRIFPSQATVDIPMPDWSKEDHVHANILHAVRVFMFKAAEGSDIIHDEGLKELVEEMKNKLEIKQDSKQEIYQAIEYIQQHIRGLNESQLKDVANNFNEVMTYISNSIHKKSDHETMV